MKNNDNIKKDLIEQIYDLAVEEKIEEIEYKGAGLHVKIKRRGKKSSKHGIFLPQHMIPVEQLVQKEPIEYKKVKSPLNGTFYTAASPTSSPYVKEGDVVDTGVVLCIVEAMKVMNEIHADKRMKVIKIMVENGKPVNVDQDLFHVEEM